MVSGIRADQRRTVESRIAETRYTPHEVGAARAGRPSVRTSLRSGEVDEGVDGVGVLEGYGDGVAHIQTCCSVDDHAFDRRVKDADEGALGVGAGEFGT